MKKHCQVKNFGTFDDAYKAMCEDYSHMADPLSFEMELINIVSNVAKNNTTAKIYKLVKELYILAIRQNIVDENVVTLYSCGAYIIEKHENN